MSMTTKVVVSLLCVVVLVQIHGIWYLNKRHTSHDVINVVVDKIVRQEAGMNQTLKTTPNYKEEVISTTAISLNNSTKLMKNPNTNSSKIYTAKKKNIMFLKTHKTASSAVQNLLLRYGIHKNRTIAMPMNRHDFNYPSYIHRSTVYRLADIKEFNILCHHMRFQPDVVEEMMPKKSTVYVSILREPGSQFESSFSYFWPIVPSFQKVPQNEPGGSEKYLDNAEKFVKEAKPNAFSVLEKNPTFFDFGYNNRNDDDTYIANSIKEINKTFDLILISDYFKESMILLRDIMGWEIEDVACLTLNARSQSKMDIDSHNTIREKARRWNKADAAIYDHFNATFWKKVDTFGKEQMNEALNELEKVISDLSELCLEGAAVDSKYVSDLKAKSELYMPRNVAVKSYNLKKTAINIPICKQLIASENPFSAEVFNIQNKRIFS